MPLRRPGRPLPPLAHREPDHVPWWTMRRAAIVLALLAGYGLTLAAGQLLMRGRVQCEVLRAVRAECIEGVPKSVAEACPAYRPPFALPGLDVRVNFGGSKP